MLKRYFPYIGVLKIAAHYALKGKVRCARSWVRAAFQRERA